MAYLGELLAFLAQVYNERRMTQLHLKLSFLVERIPFPLILHLFLISTTVASKTVTSVVLILSIFVTSDAVLSFFFGFIAKIYYKPGM